MKIYSWNVNGIRSALRKGALSELVDAEQPDIICLQETKAQPNEIETGLTQYKNYWNPAFKKGYSGTGILSKFEPIKTTHNLPKDLLEKYDMTKDGYGDPNTEGRILAAEYEQFFLVTVYTPNAKDDLSRIPLRRDHWDPAFLEYCKRLEKTKPVIFCGDLNVAHKEIDLARPKSNKGKKGFTTEERAGFDAFLAAGYTDTFRMFESGGEHYTYWSAMGGARARNVGWRIDYFLVSPGLKDKVIEAKIHPQIMGSDHCPISITLSV